jgi:hypothetical protein
MVEGMREGGETIVDIESLYRHRSHDDRTHFDKCANMVRVFTVDKLCSLVDYPLLVCCLVVVPFAFVTPYILLVYGLLGFLGLYGSLCAVEVALTVVEQEPMYEYYKKIIEHKW